MYLAESPASALLEVCVHTSANDVPPEFTLLRVEGPDQTIPEVKLEDLPSDWTHRSDISQHYGDTWLQTGDSPLLRVPSSIVPETFNILLNPEHELADQVQITESFAYPFDIRLKK